MAYLASILRSAVQRISDAPQTLSKVAAKLGPRVELGPKSNPPPAHVTTRLETVFEELSELAFQPHVAAALELACDALEAELPTVSLAAGVYDIDCDEIRFLTARGVGCDLLRGTAMSRTSCLVGHSAEAPMITRGDTEGASWIGYGEDDSSVLLCPVLHDATLLGVIALADPLCAASFTQHDMDLVRYVAAQLGAFIHTHRQRPAREDGVEQRPSR